MIYREVEKSSKIANISEIYRYMMINRQVFFILLVLAAYFHINFGYKLLIFGRFFFWEKWRKTSLWPQVTVSHRRTFHVVSHVGPKSQSPIKPALHARASQALVAPGHSLPPVLQCVTNCISILRKIKF